MAHQRGFLIGSGLALAATAAVMTGAGAGAGTVFLVLAVAVVALVFFREVAVPEKKPVAPNSPSGSLPTGFGRALLEQIPSAILVVSARGRISYANNAARQMLPTLKPGDHYANLFRDPRFVSAANQVLETGEAGQVSFSVEHGRRRHYDAHVGPLPEGSEFGESAQVLIQIVDRTADKSAEDMRRDFIANASHELRTPLASMLGYIETLQGHARNDPEARQQFLDIMDKQGRRMQRLVDDLMSLSRIEMNEHLPPSASCDLNALVEEVVRGLRPFEAERGVMIDCDLGPSPVTVTGDRDQLHQVFVNLIDNAMKYGGEGDRVEVRLVTGNPRYPGRIGVAITDHGAGIAREHLHRLTERFYRVNVAQSRNKGGTGLGLAIVKHILNRHGGALDVQSTLGRGSVFTAWLRPGTDSVANRGTDSGASEQAAEK